MNLNPRAYSLSAALLGALALSACSIPNETATRAATVATGNISNSEAIGVMRNLNNGEIEQAELALQRSETRAVREVAERIRDDHREANGRIDRMLQSGLRSEESPLSRGLSAQANAIRSELNDKYGTEFDCLYLQKQIEQHRLALETVRNDLLPDIQTEEVRQYLETAAGSLEQHQRAATTARQGITQCPRM